MCPFLGQPPAKTLLSASGKQKSVYATQTRFVCSSDTCPIVVRRPWQHRPIEDGPAAVLTSASCRPIGSLKIPRSRPVLRTPTLAGFNAAVGTVFRTREQEERTWPVTHQR